MITKNPAIISALNCAKTGFSFIVKEGEKNYSVYDTTIFSRKRELAAIEGDDEYISLNKELLDMYGLSYKKVSDTRIELFNPECEAAKKSKYEKFSNILLNFIFLIYPHFIVFLYLVIHRL